MPSRDDSASGVTLSPPPDASAPRVLHLRSSCGLYGAEGVIMDLVRHYPGASLTVCLADARDPHTELCDRLASEGGCAEALPSRGAFDPVLVLRFARLLRRVKPDVIHTHEYKSDALAFLATRALPAARRVPLVATMHGVVRTTGALRRYERLDARVLRRFDAVVAVSAGTSAIAREYGVGGARLHVIPNGVDTARFRPGRDRASARERLGVPPDGALIGMVGRLSEEKGPDILLEAFAAVEGEARLVYIGDGPMLEPLRARAAAMGLSERVTFAGRRDDMEQAYAALDVLALPSLSEGLPLTVLEASACGVPVVASDVGDVGRVLPHGEAGLLVAPGEPGALTIALTGCIAEPDRARAMAETARRRVEGSWSAAALARAYEDVYRRVSGRAQMTAPAGAER